MQKISVSTIISRYSLMASQVEVERVIKHKMANDLAHEILKVVDVEEYENWLGGDKKFTMRFFVTTSHREAKIIDVLMKAMEDLIPIKKA